MNLKMSVSLLLLCIFLAPSCYPLYFEDGWRMAQRNESEYESQFIERLVSNLMCKYNEENQNEAKCDKCFQEMMYEIMGTLHKNKNDVPPEILKRLIARVEYYIDHPTHRTAFIASSVTSDTVLPELLIERYLYASLLFFTIFQELLFSTNTKDSEPLITRLRQKYPYYDKNFYKDHVKNGALEIYFKIYAELENEISLLKNLQNAETRQEISTVFVRYLGLGEHSSKLILLTQHIPRWFDPQQEETINQPQITKQSTVFTKKTSLKNFLEENKYSIGSVVVGATSVLALLYVMHPKSH